MRRPCLDWVQEGLAGKQTCSTTTTGGDQSAPPPASSAKAISISGHMFMPQDVTVPTGTTVTWTNDDSDPHNVVADGGAFQSKNLDKGASYSHTFTSAG